MADEEVVVSAARLRLLERDANLAHALWNDPQHGMKIKEIAKEKWPDSNIPELDAIKEVRKTETDLVAKIEAKEKALEDKISAWEKKQADKEEKENYFKAEREFAIQVDDTKKKYQLTAEGMEKVFQRMKEKNNPDVEAAAAWVTDHEQAAAPINQPSAQGNFNPYGANGVDKDWELLNKNPWDGKFAEQEINRITRDFANGQGHKYGVNGMGGEL